MKKLKAISLGAIFLTFGSLWSSAPVKTSLQHLPADTVRHMILKKSKESPIEAVQLLTTLRLVNKNFAKWLVSEEAAKFNEKIKERYSIANKNFLDKLKLIESYIDEPHNFNLIRAIQDKDKNALEVAFEKPFQNWYTFKFKKPIIIDDINKKFGTQFIDTPLTISIKTDSYDIAKFLLENGADATIALHQNYKPIHFAISKKMAELLVKHGADVKSESLDKTTPLHLAKNLALATFLIESGADINAKNIDGMPVLFSAIDEQKPEIVQLLLNKNVDLNTKVFNEYLNQSMNALEFAKQLDNKEIIDMINKKLKEKK